MSNAISEIIELKVKIEAVNRYHRPKWQWMLILVGFMILSVLAGGSVSLYAVMMSYGFIIYHISEIKKEALAPIVDALLEIEEQLDSSHD